MSTYTGNKIVCINSKWKAESSSRKPAVDGRDWTLSFKIPSFIPALLDICTDVRVTFFSSAFHLVCGVNVRLFCEIVLLINNEQFVPTDFCVLVCFS